MQVESAGIRVTNALPKLDAFLSERAKNVIARQRHDTTPEMFTFGRVYRKIALVESDYAEFAEKFNEVCDKLDGRLYPHVEDLSLSHGMRPVVDATLAVPMELPLANNRVMLVIYVFIYNLPFWSWREVMASTVSHIPDDGMSDETRAAAIAAASAVIDDPTIGISFYRRTRQQICVFDSKRAREWLKEVTGFVFVGEGEIPCDHLAVKECGRCKLQFCIDCGHEFAQGTYAEVKTVGHVCDCCKIKGYCIGFGSES